MVRLGVVFCCTSVNSCGIWRIFCTGFLRAAEPEKKNVIQKMVRVGNLDDSIFADIERPLEVTELRVIGDSAL